MGPGSGVRPVKKFWKRLLFKGLPVYDFFEPAAHAVELRLWAFRGRPSPPPPAFKQRTVAGYGRRFSLTTLVETGTFLGDLASAAGKTFERVVTIELDPHLYARARRRLARRPNITVLHGDSGDLLPEVLETLRGPCLFWLDAHYSGPLTARAGPEPPILRELRAVLAGPEEGQVVLIDDACCFTGEGGYPALEILENLVRDLRPGWAFEVRDDIVRCHAPRPGSAGPRRS